MRILLLSLLCLACSGGDGLRALPPPTLASWCRCTPYERHLALVRVESEPAAFQDTRYNVIRNGMEYDATVERSLSSVSNPHMLPAMPTRFRARQYTTTRTGNPGIAGTTWDHPQYVRVARGDLLLVEMYSGDPDDPNRWSIGPKAANPMTGALTQPLFSFPVGTAAAQVLDPAEWTCTPATPVRGYCPVGDAGPPDA